MGQDDGGIGLDDDGAIIEGKDSFVCFKIVTLQVRKVEFTHAMFQDALNFSKTQAR